MLYVRHRLKTREQTKGNGPSRRPAKGQKGKDFLILRKDTVVKISSILQCQRMPKKKRIRVENHVSYWKQQNTHLSQPKTSQKTKN